MHMQNHHFSKTKPPPFVLVGFIVSSLVCCGVPVPREYKYDQNQEKLNRYAEEDTVDFLQCDGLAKFDFVIGPNEECIIKPLLFSCPVIVKRERFLSNGYLDKTPENIGLDTLRWEWGPDTNYIHHTLFHLNRTEPGEHYSDAHFFPYNEYFKITIYCINQFDGYCRPKLQIKRK